MCMELNRKKLRINKTRFIPIDSEHFSIWSLIKDSNENIEKIFNCFGWSIFKF